MTTTTLSTVCTLCHRRPVIFGVWHPNQATRAEMGMPRRRFAVGYALCRKHSRTPQTSIPKVEDRIIAKYRETTGFTPERN